MTDAERIADAKRWTENDYGLPPRVAKDLVALATELEAKLAEAERERIEALDRAAHRERQLSAAFGRESAAESREKALREENGVLRAALRRYGMHSFSCPVTRARSLNPNCRCGFRAALAAAEASP